MLNIGQISVWGILLVILLSGAAIAFLWLVDQRLLRKALRLRVHLPRLPQQVWLPLAVAMVCSAAAMAGVLSLCLHGGPFWLLLVFMMVCLLSSTPRAMEDYVRCLRNTQQHRLYLLANGANHLESLVPGARRALRGALLPLLWQRSSAMPFAMALFFLTLLVCGLSFGAALLLTLLVWLSAIAAAVIAAVLSMWLADRQLFDRNERLRVAEQ